MPPPASPSRELEDLAQAVRRLRPDWRNAEAFYEARSEVVGGLKRLARVLDGLSPEPPPPATVLPFRPPPPARTPVQPPPAAPAPSPVQAPAAALAPRPVVKATRYRSRLPMPPAGSAPLLPMPGLDRWQSAPGAPAMRQRLPLPVPGEDQPSLLLPLVP
jgi:hypothetical protein